MKKLLLIIFALISFNVLGQSIESTTGLDSAYYEFVKLNTKYIPNDYPSEGFGNSKIFQDSIKEPLTGIYPTYTEKSLSGNWRGSIFIGNSNIKEYMPYSYLWLREKYKQHCDSIVIDTLEETGIIHYRVNPQNGEFKLIPLDTVWEEKECREFLINKNNLTWWTSDTGVSVNTIDDHNMVLSASGTIRNRTYSTPIQYFTTEIKRFKYCKIKYKRGSQEDFWNWTEQKYLSK